MTHLLEQQIKHLKHYTSAHTLKDETISKADIGWHIAHILLTIDGVAKALQQANPSQYKWTFNITRWIVLWTGKIPRGKAKAPKIVQPQAELTEQHLQNSLEQTLHNITLLQNINTNHFFAHPYFGNIKLKKAIRFLETHTQHHINIIKEIGNSKV